jgi:hypothetical protein
MPDFSETYASPGLRWGLLLEDHPNATRSFALTDAAGQNVPAEYGGAQPVCVCTIAFGSDRPDVVAYKKVSGKGDPDDWNLLCTKTLGRALKAAGYPDDMKDLKALVLWRQRNAEVEAIEGGHVMQAIEAGPQPDDDDLTRAAIGQHPDDDTTDAVIVGDDGDPPDDQAYPTIRALMTKLKPVDQTAAQAWAREQGYKLLNPVSQEHADAIIDHLEAMQDG